MLIKTSLLIVYFTTVVSSRQILNNLSLLPSSNFEIFRRLHENEEVLQSKPDEHRPPYNNTLIVEFHFNDEKIKLNLTLSTRNVVSNDVPIWTLKSKFEQTPNYTYELLKNTKRMLDGRFYVDNEKKATLLTRHNEKQNKFLYDGVIGEGSGRRLLHAIADHTHTRAKRANQEFDNYIMIDSPENFDSDNDSIIIERNGVELTKLDKPLEILYPKMLVVVDYHLFTYLNFDVAETVRYIATFWNIVDQKYEKIQSPKIQIIVAGIVVVHHEEVLDNIYQYKTGTDESDIRELLNNARLFFTQNFINDTGFKDYDAIMIMSGLKMKLLEGLADIYGLAAKLGTICTKNYNIAITTDKAQYNTLIAIHELGHLLNLSHDFAEECNGITYLFDSLNTSVMSAPSDGSDIFWSECSMKLLKEFSSLRAAECLKSRHRGE